MTERQLQKQVEDYLNLLNMTYCDKYCEGKPLLWYHNNRTDVRDNAGFPDLIVWGKWEKFNSISTYLIELKVGKNKQTKEQAEWEKWFDEIKYSEIYYLLCYSLEEVVKKTNNFLLPLLEGI